MEYVSHDAYTCLTVWFAFFLHLFPHTGVSCTMWMADQVTH